VTAMELIIYAPLNVLAYGIGTIADLVFTAINKIKEFGQICEALTTRVVDCINKCLDNLQSWWKENFNSGYKYASANPLIKVDTYKLMSYASRLQSVNRRIVNLDQRLNSLYWKVGFSDLWSLSQAEALTGYSWNINRCIAYLADTANDFENAENEINNSL